MGIQLEMRVSVSFSEKEKERLAALSDALKPWQAVLSLSQVLALAEVAQSPGLSVNELAERLSLPQQTVSRHVAILLGRYQATSEAGPTNTTAFIRQEISTSDPRRRALFLSEDGLALLKSLAADAPQNSPSLRKLGNIQ
jgi:DNA-binding MarR family transcriptional regulator